jgi:urease accessory protein
MLEFTRHLGAGEEQRATEELWLDYEGRCRARQRVRLQSGREAGLFLDRGKALAEGDILCADDGTQAVVRCRPEAVITARAEDWEVFARGCYHLGNRHAPVQIGRLWLRFTPDAVLERLVIHLGFATLREEAPFAAESGAYGHSRPEAGEGAHRHAGDR